MMKTFRVVPEIFYFDTFQEFAEAFALGEGDLLVTNRWIYDPYIKPLGFEGAVLFQEDYGSGEPSDQMIDALIKDARPYTYDRILALGGGTILDICKILALDIEEPSKNLFAGVLVPEQKKQLVAIPTTCGTGSEVTNVVIAEQTELHTKKGFASDEAFPTMAVLIPEVLQSLPEYAFVTSSIDALIHGSESYLSPGATPASELFSLEAIRLILNGYEKIYFSGGDPAEQRKAYLKDFCCGANYAGIAFGNAGCAAVHAISYAIGGAFHVAHGEANYQFFTEVFKLYQKKAPEGKIRLLNRVFAEILGCEENQVYAALEGRLDRILPRKPLRQYGMKPDQIDLFTDYTLENQQRLLKNNYVPLSREEIRAIFEARY